MAAFNITLPPAVDGSPKTRTVKVGWNQESASQEVESSKKTAIVEVPDGVSFAVICDDVRQSFNPAGEPIGVAKSRQPAMSATPAKAKASDKPTVEGPTSGK